MGNPRCAVALAAALSAAAPSLGAHATPLHAVDRAFTRYDPNGDGKAEIQSVQDLGIDREARESRRGTLLVIVEPRLLADSVGRPPLRLPSLRPALKTFAQDLADDGWRVHVVAMHVYAGPDHQDGRTLLAMREYLRAIRKVAPDLAGAVLIGSFPEAMLVRQYNWRQLAETVLYQGKPNEERFGGKPVVRIRSVPELVAWRSDLPLADLDGHWERLYHQPPEDLPSILAVYPDAKVPEGHDPESEWHPGGPTRYFETGSHRFEDFFFINDGRYAADPMPDGTLNLRLLDDQRDDECSEADRARGNPMARPDLLISRINARHVALRPKPDVRGTHGEGLIGPDGRPQAVTFASEKETPRGLDVWEWDPVLERQLLREYFARNHRYRTGAYRRHFRPAAAEFGLGSPMPELRQARPEWHSFAAPEFDLGGEQATLLAVVQWLKRPALLRHICAHSDPWGCHFNTTADTQALERECGGTAWSWIRQGNRLVPTLGVTGKLDFPILRTLWQNRALPDTACFYLHSGCEATAPEGAPTLPYSHPTYGHWQGAESLLFYAGGLALVGRSKVFYDFPTDFARKLGEGRTFGEAWAHYFEAESAEPDVRKVGGGIGRKRAYFWGVLGDWTLRLMP